ncbi:MAG TPA: hypothetical protein VGZ90_19510 [Puia sp.]|jgi:hypothetical protein|nr:hypothetical protein [Puia sp.]
MPPNTGSYFVFHKNGPGDPSPRPKPEWPPVEPTPMPPETDPVPPSVPPVTSEHFQLYSFMLN